MRFSTAVIAYVITILLCIVLPLALKIYAGRSKKLKLSPLHCIVGVLFFAVFLAAYYLVLRYHLNADGGVADYFNTAFYRVTIVVLISLVMSILLWVFGMIVYSRRQNLRGCTSFYIGFGYPMALIFGVYAMFMLVGLISQYCTSTLEYFDETIQAFYFSSGTYFTMFTPIMAHISYAVAFVSVLFIAFSFSVMMNHLTMRNVPLKSTIPAFLGHCIAMSLLVTFIFFITMFDWAHYLLAVIALISDALCFWMLTIVYRSTEKISPSYTKQFD